MFLESFFSAPTANKKGVNKMLQQIHLAYEQ